MLPQVSRAFSLFGRAGSSYDKKRGGQSTGVLTQEVASSLKLQTDREVYRPGDSVTATIEIWNPHDESQLSEMEHALNENYSLLIENLKFEIKGIEKLDAQWFTTQKPLPGSKQRRGEQIFLDCTTPSIVSKVILAPRHTKSYIVRAELPKILPPSYRGCAIRYLYYVRSTLSGRWLVLENGNSNWEPAEDLVQLEARAPLQIWPTQKNSGLLTEEGSLPVSSVPMDIYWKEKDVDSEWQVRASEIFDGNEEGYESSRDEISSVSSYNPTRNIDVVLRNSLSLQSSTPGLSSAELSYGERSSFPSYMAPTQLSVAEVSYDPNGDVLAPDRKPTHPAILSPSQRRKHAESHFSNDNTGVPSSPGTAEPAAYFIRGRSYNIRMDEQDLLRFSPKNSDSTYYFGDTIGGTLTFFHEGPRRCLEISITLETSETVNQRYVHPSRRNSTTITKVQSEHYEIVADLVQTSFLFSIPVDGPMSFSTPHISVQWALRFEFLTTTKNVNWTRFEHPLLVEGRDKSEWVLPIIVHAPPQRTLSAQERNERPLSLGALWVRS